MKLRLPYGSRGFQPVKEVSEGREGVEGEPSGFPTPRRAKRITRPQAAKSGGNRADFLHFCSAWRKSPAYAGHLRQAAPGFLMEAGVFCIDRGFGGVIEQY